jgi:Thiolase, C-terminal domain/Thiolase, N-terminal domain
VHSSLLTPYPVKKKQNVFTLPLLFHVRHNTELNTLLNIRSAFPQWPPSQTTGGNASQNSDGAAAVLLMTRSRAKELGLKILGKHVATTVVGVPPRIMGIAPAYAIPAVLKLVGIHQDDVDLFEVGRIFFPPQFLPLDLVIYWSWDFGFNIDKRGVRFDVRLCCQDTRVGREQGECERWGDRPGISPRLYWSASGGHWTRRTREEKGQGPYSFVTLIGPRREHGGIFFLVLGVDPRDEYVRRHWDGGCCCICQRPVKA